MHLLPCPACQSAIPVSPSQAGDQTRCPSCQELVDIPKLGHLRQLPLAEHENGTKNAGNHLPGSRPESSSGNRAAFLALAVIATLSLLIAGFSTVRWAMIETPKTTDEHLAEFHETYKTLNPAELIREYEQMEETGLDLPLPLLYKKNALQKAAWARSAGVAGTVGGVAILGALVFSFCGRGNRKQSTDT